MKLAQNVQQTCFRNASMQHFTLGFKDLGLPFQQSTLSRLEANQAVQFRVIPTVK